MRVDWAVRVAIALFALVLGYGASCVDLRGLEAKQASDHERLVRIENDVAWIKSYLQRRDGHGILDNGHAPQGRTK